MLIVSAGISFGIPGGDRGLARRRLARSGLEDLAHDHVLDLARLEPRALEGGADRERAELRRSQVREPAAEAAEGRSDRRDDDRRGHGVSLAGGVGATLEA